ncbi:MAG: EAL domain-containing protein [Armatimonadetes bacterium]|nr:EAL domain-containing protein [Armatimonadota bacterium]
MRRHVIGEDNCFQATFRVVLDDKTYWLRGKGCAASRGPDGVAEVILGATVDVTTETTARLESEESRQRLNNLLVNIADMVFELVRTDDGEYELVYVNEGVLDLFGLSIEQAGNDFMSLLEVIQTRFHLRVMSTLSFSAESMSPWHSVFQIEHPRRGKVWAEGYAQPVLGEDGLVHWHGSIRDITERVAMEEELAVTARLDPLTGLANRSLYLDRLTDAISRHKTSAGTQFAVLFLDVDNFKTLNDSLGHAAGDELLVQMAVRLNQHVRTDSSTSRRTQQDTAARLGGDEFIVLIQNVTAGNASKVARRLLDILSKPYRIAGTTVVPTVSIGVVMGDSRYEEAGEILRDADIAMYAAKESGRGCYRLFDSAMHDSAVRKMGLENDLRTAIQNGELRLVYQPIVSLSTGDLECAETLLRWDHPVLGPVSPAEFIPIAEETGTISAIGEWVIEQACAQLVKWRSTNVDIPSISVNLSRDQLSDLQLVKKVGKYVDRHGLPPELIHFEITESTVMRDPGAAQIVLSELRERGHKLSLDDFGTGYSSLSSLHQFPLDYLKIDKSFVHNLAAGDDHLILIRAITRLATVMDIHVVVEGIETAEQLSKLRSAGCELGQGYFFSRPVSPEDLAKLITERWSNRKAA